MLTFTENGSDRILKIDGQKLTGFQTESLRIRTGFINGTLFLTQRGKGNNGAGDICKISEINPVPVNSNLFNRIVILAKKAEAIISINSGK